MRWITSSRINCDAELRGATCPARRSGSKLCACGGRGLAVIGALMGVHAAQTLRGAVLDHDWSADRATRRGHRAAGIALTADAREGSSATSSGPLPGREPLATRISPDLDIPQGEGLATHLGSVDFPFLHHIVDEFAVHDDTDQFRAGLDLLLAGLRLQAGPYPPTHASGASTSEQGVGAAVGASDGCRQPHPATRDSHEAVSFETSAVRTRFKAAAPGCRPHGSARMPGGRRGGRGLMGAVADGERAGGRRA